MTGSILATGAAGQHGAVGRTVTSLVLERGLPVRAMVHREEYRAAALRAAGAEVVVGDLLEPADMYRVVASLSPTTVLLETVAESLTQAHWR
jgi:NAD(P)H dehydrogenase (quinone)